MALHGGPRKFGGFYRTLQLLYRLVMGGLGTGIHADRIYFLAGSLAGGSLCPEEFENKAVQIYT